MLDHLKRVIVLGTIFGLGVLALFIASETRNILATSDKSVLFIMPGMPVLIGIGLLYFLDASKYFVLSIKLLILFTLCIVGLMVFEAGGVGGAARNLEAMRAKANLQGTLYAATVFALVWFVGYGAYASLRGPREAVARSTSRGKVGRWVLIVGGIALAVLILAVMTFYYSAPPVELRGVDGANEVDTAPRD